MTILIEDAETNKYFADGSQWTALPGDGAPFASSHSAVAAAKKEPIGKFNIVLYFSSTRQFVNLDHGSGRGH